MGNKKIQRQIKAIGRWIVVCVSAVVCAVFVHMPPHGWAGTQATEQTARRLTCDPALATSVTAAMFGHKEKKIFLVDVRPAAEFSKYHIPGALNIPLHAIKAKPFLKAKPIVLVNKGYEVGPLAGACRILKTKGFKVTIMAGGLCAWKSRGGALTGDHFSQRGMNHVTPQQFHKENAYDHQVVVRVTATAAAENWPGIPGNRKVALSNAKSAVSQIRKWIKAKQSGPFSAVVLVAADEKQGNRIQRLLADAGLLHQVFILHGGRQAYETHLNHAALAIKPRKDRQKRTGGCRSCAQE